MSISGSYNIDNFAVNREREILRLNSQVDLFWEQEYLLYKKLGLRDGMNILDCGCGPGHLIEKLCNLYPLLNCTGIEIADYLFQAASKNIQSKKLTRCTVFKQSILKLDFPDNTFDFIVIRLVLEHLPDPIAAMLEVKRVLKAGGRAVFIDNDFDYHVQTYPAVPELNNLYTAYCKARKADRGSPCIGRQLPQLLSLSGFSDVSFDVLAANNHITGDLAFQQSEGSGIALQLLQDGFLSAEDYNNLAVNWSSMLKTNDHSIVRLLFAGSGKKSDASTQQINQTGVDKKSSNQTIEHKNSCTTDLSVVSEKDLLQDLRNTISQILEIPSDQILPDTPLGNTGLDSVGSVMLRNQLEIKYNIIPGLEYFYNHSINDIIKLIEDTKSLNSDNSTIAKQDRFEEGEI